MRTRVVWLTAVLCIGIIGIGSSHAQENLLANGGFEDGVFAPWSTYGNVTTEVVKQLVGAAVSEGPIEGDYCLHLVVPVAGANFWDAGLQHTGHVFQAGKKYTLSAFCKCKQGTLTINFKPELAQDPWTGYGEQPFTMTDEWVEYSITTPVFTTDASPANITFHIAYTAGDFWMDCVRFYEGDYVPPELGPRLQARKPNPANGGLIPELATYLTWTPGDTAVSHEGFFSSNWADVNDRKPSASLGEVTDPFYYVFGLTRSVTYYWCIDEKDVNDIVYKSGIWSFTVMPLKAWSPTPLNGEAFVTRTPTLSWNQGAGAIASLVYLSTSSAFPSGSYKTVINHAVGQLRYSYPVTTALAYDTTYYWRIDQREPNNAILKGDTWSFKTARSGGGLRGDYYDNMDFTSYVLSRIDPQINFNWGDPGSPDPSIGVDTFSVRWLGEIEIPPASGNYTFTTNTDDGVRLWVNDQLVVNSWVDQGATNHSGTIYLVGGQKYGIQMDYYENGGGAVAYLYWQGPATSYGLVPQAAFSPPLRASNPDPADGTDGVPLSGTLGWTAGAYAVSHDVYIGTNYSDVNTATTSSHPNVTYYNRNVNNCPIGPLSSGTVYYWRVDEVNTVPPHNGLWKGKIWVFRTLGGGGGLLGLYYHWYDGIVRAGGDPGPAVPFQTFVLSRIDPTVNFGWGDGTAGTPGSPAPGIVNIDLFACKWLGSVNAPVAGKYIFYTATDDGQRLFIDGQLVIDHWVDQGTTEYSSPQLTLTAGWHDIEMHQYENGGGATAYLRWEGPIMTKQIIPAWYLSPPLKASVPLPNDGDPEAPPTVILGWRRGDKAAKHDVYFSTDFNDVNEATTLSPPSIYRGRRDPNTYDPPEQLEMNQTYYWRVDEVNGTTVWPGNVWSFTVANYLVVDDFEPYTNFPPNIIWQTWIWGMGGEVGYPDPNCAELTIIHGGRQSMPFDYSNHYSDAIRTFTASQDWTAYGVKALSLWLRGYPVTFGSFVESPAGTYTMTARGADIFNVADLRRPSRFHDEFHYAYWQVYGDYAITAKVESITNTNGWAKAGVMVRDSLDANSVHAMACLTPSVTNGVAFQHRAAAGGISIADFNIPNINPPYWVSMTRRGTNLAAGYAPDGLSWSGLYNTTVTMTDPVYIGLSLTAHNTAATCTAVFSDVHLYTVDPVGNVTEVLPLPSWTHQDIGIKSNVPATLSVTLRDSYIPTPKTATVIHPDPNIVLQNTWQEWNIALSEFTNQTPSLDLKKISKITITVAEPANVVTGTLYFDDIRLYPPRCFPDLVKPLADFSDDCLVGYADLAILTDNWLVKPPSSVSSGLKGYWPFNGNLQDVSGNDRNGSDPCGVITYAASQAGQAASLNGGYVLVGPVGISGAAARSVAGWAKASTMSMPTADWISVFGFTCSGATLTNRSFDINKWGLGNDYAIHVYGWEQAILPVDLEWHHLAASYDGTTIRGYGDGQLIVEDSSRVLDTNDLVQMGRRGDQTANFQGMIDEVRIYSRALSQAEIEYLAGKPMIDGNNDGAVDFRDYTIMADMWLEELLWPQ